MDRFCPTPRAKLYPLDHEYVTSNWPDARSDPETTQSPPVHARHAPTVGETQLLLQIIRNEGGYPTNLIVRMLYGCVMMPLAQPGLGISGTATEPATWRLAIG